MFPYTHVATTESEERWTYSLTDPSPLVTSQTRIFPTKRGAQRAGNAAAFRLGRGHYHLCSVHAVLAGQYVEEVLRKEHLRVVERRLSALPGFDHRALKRELRVLAKRCAPGVHVVARSVSTHRVEPSYMRPPSYDEMLNWLKGDGHRVFREEGTTHAVVVHALGTHTWVLQDYPSGTPEHPGPRAMITLASDPTSTQMLKYSSVLAMIDESGVQR